MEETDEYKIITVHKPSDIGIAKSLFEGYLTDEELSERQLSGREWSISHYPNFTALYIVVDDETSICITKTNGRLEENIIQGKAESLPTLLLEHQLRVHLTGM